MKKIILLLNVVVIAFTSCSKSEEEPAMPIDQSVNIFLKKAITKDKFLTKKIYLITQLNFIMNNVMKM